MSDGAAALSDVEPKLYDSPIVCPACGDHFRGTDYESQDRHNPFTLNCCHTFCRACVEAMEGARTETEVPVCHVCRKPVTSSVLNQGIADFSEAVYVGNGWARDDPPEEAPARARPEYPPEDPNDPEVIEARRKVKELGQRCRYGAQKMREAKERIMATKARMHRRLEASIAKFDAQIEELKAKVIEHRDKNIKEAEDLCAERSAILTEQARELREAAETIRACVARCEEAIASGDAERIAAAHEEALKLTPLTQLQTTPKVSPLVDIVTKTGPVLEAIERLTRICEGVDADHSPVTGTGATSFLTGDTEAARAHNVIDVVCRDNTDMLLDMIEAEDAYMVISGVEGLSMEELDASVELKSTLIGDGTIRINYVVKNPAIKDITLRVDIASVPIAGSPFKLHASN